MRNKRKSIVLFYSVLILGAFVFLVPYIYMVVSSTQTTEIILGKKLNFSFGAHFQENLHYIQERYDYLLIIGNSLLITVVGTFVSTLLTTLCGYAMAKYHFKGNQLLFNLIMVSRMIPSFAVLIPTYFILSRLGLTNTFTGVIVPSLASTTSVFMMRQYAQQFPSELMEAARIDGAGEWTIFWKIAVPVLQPSIITTALLTFMGYWNSYLYPLVILSEPKKYTVPLIIQSITQNQYEPVNYGALMALLTTSVLPIIAFYFWVQRKFKSSGLDSAIK